MGFDPGRETHSQALPAEQPFSTGKIPSIDNSQNYLSPYECSLQRGCRLTEGLKSSSIRYVCQVELPSAYMYSYIALQISNIDLEVHSQNSRCSTHHWSSDYCQRLFFFSLKLTLDFFTSLLVEVGFTFTPTLLPSSCYLLRRSPYSLSLACGQLYAF